jgi:hypothetical protein
MKRLLLIVLFLALAFYVAWPAYTAYQINTALKTKDAAVLEQKIDFPRVRESLRPAVAQTVEQAYMRTQQQAGGVGGNILAKLRQDVLPGLIDATLNTLVTPNSLAWAATEGKSFKEAIERAIRNQMARAGGVPGSADDAGASPSRSGINLGKVGEIAGRFGIDTGKVLGTTDGKAPAGDAQAPADGSQTPGEPKRYGMANIKSVMPTGPLSFEVGVAREAAAPAPDLIVEMSFTGLDWKVTALTPRL